jgi:hypothetical protein
MRFAYLTTDEVNEALALEIAHACGLALEPLVPKQGPPDAAYDAVLIDWDHWPSEQQAEFLARLRGGLLPWPVGIHSYCLDDGAAETLRTGGAIIHRRLQPGVIRLLQKAAAARAHLDNPVVM